MATLDPAKDIGKTLEFVSCFPLHFFNAPATSFVLYNRAEYRIQSSPLYALKNKTTELETSRKKCCDKTVRRYQRLQNFLSRSEARDIFSVNVVTRHRNFSRKLFKPETEIHTSTTYINI